MLPYLVDLVFHIARPYSCRLEALGCMSERIVGVAGMKALFQRGVLCPETCPKSFPVEWEPLVSCMEDVGLMDEVVRQLEVNIRGGA